MDQLNNGKPRDRLEQESLLEAQRFFKLKVWATKSFTGHTINMAKQSGHIFFNVCEVPQLCMKLMALYLCNDGLLLHALSVRRELTRLIKEQTDKEQMKRLSFTSDDILSGGYDICVNNNLQCEDMVGYIKPLSPEPNQFSPDSASDKAT